MSDKIIARFQASHSARGIRLSAHQAGIMKPHLTPPAQEETDIQ